jgi:hypothetical protein
MPSYITFERAARYGETGRGEQSMTITRAMERRHPAGRYAGILPAFSFAGWKPAERPAGSRRSK